MTQEKREMKRKNKKPQNNKNSFAINKVNINNDRAEKIIFS